MGDSKIPSRILRISALNNIKRAKTDLRTKIPAKFVTAALQIEQVPKPSIIRGITRAAENRFATIKVSAYTI
jgi:hypothetical protein